MQEINKDDFEEKVFKAKLPVMVEFETEWSSPCKKIKSVMNQLRGEYHGKIDMYECNIDKNIDLAVKYGIRHVPTVIIYEKGKIKEVQIGATNKKKYKEELDKHIKEKPGRT
jgi:thioredoxin 1